MRWGDDDIEWIRQHADTMTRLDIANHFGVSWDAINGVGSRWLIGFTYKRAPKRVRSRRRPLSVAVGDDAPHRTVDYGGISVTWTVGEWRRLQKVKDSRPCVDTIGRGEA